jgi:hypothetical protein
MMLRIVQYARMDKSCTRGTQWRSHATSAENPPRAGYKAAGGKTAWYPMRKATLAMAGHSAPTGTATAVHLRKRSGGRSCPTVLYAHREKETAAAKAA